MTGTTAAVALVLVAPICLACHRETPREAALQASVVTSPQDTSFAGTTAPLSHIHPSRPGAPPTMLRAVQTVSGAGYDRIVFEFAGDSLPGYSVAYAAAPTRRCGSGDPVSVAGARQLVVRFEPARAHDERGNPVPPREQRERVLTLSSVKEMKLVCDFEGQVEWVLGVPATIPYRVSELAGRPPRFVLEVGHER